MSVAKPTLCETALCETAVSNFLKSAFEALSERERLFVTEFCQFTPPLWIAEEITRLRAIAELMKNLKKLGVDPTDDDKDLREAMVEVSGGKDVGGVAQALANKRETKKESQRKKAISPRGTGLKG